MEARPGEPDERPSLDTLLQRHLPAVRAFVRLRMSALLRAHESDSDLVQSTCRELLAKTDAAELVACYSQVLSPSRQPVAREGVAALEAAFDALPEHYREVIALSRIA